MFMKFLRQSITASVILVILRIYLGYAFINAGFEKLSKGFNAAGFLKGAVAKPVVGTTGSVVYPTYLGFLKHFALPNAGLFDVIIPWGEFLVGLGLILGCLTTAAAFFALVMNFSYLMAGTISTNPWDILLGFFIIAAGYNAGRFGLDRWVVPVIRRYTARERHLGKNNV